MKKKYIEHIMAYTQQECIKRFSRNRTFIDNIGNVFNHISDNLRLIFNKKLCYHVFVNKSNREVDILTSRENIYLPKYIKQRVERLDDFKFLINISNAFQLNDKEHGIIELGFINTDDFKTLTKILLLEEANNEIDSHLIIPFDFFDLDLGFFIIPNIKLDNDSELLCDDNINNWISSVHYFLKEFLLREYGIPLKGIYIPDLFSSRWQRAAVLYADIRNFAVIYENLKRQQQYDYNNQKTFIVKEIINEYFREMVNIIQSEGIGRIDRFYGTGILAVFCEQEDNPSKACCSAILAATEMIKRYLPLKLEILEKTFGKGYEIEYNENIDINMTIGIDYGYNFFEYLGGSKHLEYTVLSDHINFAISMQQKNPHLASGIENYNPILISKTVERCTRPWIENSGKHSFTLRDNEKGYNYNVFGINQDSFNSTFYHKVSSNNAWDEAWDHEDAQKPE